MTGKRRIGVGAAVFATVLISGMALANNLNVNTGTYIPIRPHVNLNNTINAGVKIRTYQDIDLSENCRPDERIKVRGKREWRCRQDR
ncbi:hypothetical protein [Afipia clevelandensis]|uniref:Uncharacterized protein n=1 Tax=Afipia clevelandensis ATCC 49720 TaxID=883079 RepID=K8PL12_9BRAD|nr:hypothetical protein [Afipia clevelandensis]EKS40210.1 hypothetical protein HMPREF9696_00661 [Afipia clevelandensis ATCC 49720]